ncbi:cholinesterase-like [Centruroides vittatus]|uniref:cholinesterase-like n=1 Tax=Centruroides vittatus TaxID=120091 RepID=UPI0035107E4E
MTYILELQMKSSILLKIALEICIISQCMQQAHNSSILGKVSGKEVKVGDEYVHAYLGIPYVTPPVGNLRFQEPRHVRAWNSVYNATRKPLACVQDLFFENEWLKLDRKDISEDCLYINVWVPASKRDREPFATMVWIYGRGFIASSSNQRIASFVPQKGLLYLPENPFYNIDIGKFHDVDVFIGETKDEGLTLAAGYKPEIWNEENPTLSKSEVKNFLGERLDRLFEEYLGNVSEADSSTILQQFIKALGNGTLFCPILHLAEKLSRYNRKVFHYTFNHTRFQSEAKEWAGVIHFEDVYFVFGMPFVRRSAI